MRTLKVLSLVLALVLCFGLVGTAFAANTDKYTDANQIGDAYAEAVEVMMGLGVVEGKTDTTVDPTGTFTREQAAKIITYMLLGKTLADALPKDAASFDDVAAGRWSAGYINYCYVKGIVTGVTETKFNPQGTLTGYAWAKMVLGAIGYGKNGEYDDPNAWKLNVVTDALKAGICTGDVGALVDAPIQRQQAMLVAFNSLDKGGETVSTKSTVYITDGAKSSKMVYDNWADAEKAINGGDQYKGMADVTTSKTVGSLGDTTFQLTKKDAVDGNGRPTTAYYSGDKLVATIDTAANTTYSKAVTGDTLYKALGLKKAPDTVNYKVDNKAETIPTGFAIAEKNNKTVGGNGVELNAYKTVAADGKVTIDLIAINTYCGKVDSIAADGTVTIDVAGLKKLTIKTSGLAKDDLVLATYDAAKDALVTAEKVVSTAMTPSRYTAGENFIVNGTTYTYSAKFFGTKYAAGAGNKFNEANVVLDKYGYVIALPAGAAPAPVPTEYAIVLGTHKYDAEWPATDSTYKAQVVKADGSVAIIATDQDYVTDKTLNAGDVVICAPGTGAATGTTVLTKAAAFETGTNVVITKNTVKFGAKALANDKTVFLLNTKDANGNDVYTAYTGIGNVPSTVNPGTNKYTVVNNKDNFAEFVYVSVAVLDVPSTAAKTVAFVDFSSGKTVVDAEKGEFTTYKAVVDGKVTTIEVVAKTDPFKAEGKDAIWSDMTTKDGLVTAATKMSGFVSGSKTEAAANGVIGLNGDYFTYNDATQIYMISASGIKSVAVADIKTDTNDEVVYLVKDGILTAAFITAVA